MRRDEFNFVSVDSYNSVGEGSLLRSARGFAVFLKQPTKMMWIISDGIISDLAISMKEDCDSVISSLNKVLSWAHDIVVQVVFNKEELISVSCFPHHHLLLYYSRGTRVRFPEQILSSLSPMSVFRTLEPYHPLLRIREPLKQDKSSLLLRTRHGSGFELLGLYAS